MYRYLVVINFCFGGRNFAQTLMVKANDIVQAHEKVYDHLVESNYQAPNSNGECWNDDGDEHALIIRSQRVENLQDVEDFMVLLP